MMTKSLSPVRTRRGLAILLTVVTCGAGALLPHEASAATERNTYTADYCNDDGAKCGAIIYGVAGGYAVKKVRVHARSEQPSGVMTNPKCAGFDEKFTDSLNINQYDLFVVPAPCAYDIEIQIAGGKSKSRNQYLTVGCQIETKTDGTTLQNEWHQSSSWTKKALDAKLPEQMGLTKNDPPQDAQGNHCGRQSKM